MDPLPVFGQIVVFGLPRERTCRLLAGMWFITVALVCTSAGGAPLARWDWGDLFDKRTDNQGNPLTVSAVFASENHVFVYDRASRRVVVFTASLAVVDTIALESIGRGTYVGDDFVAVDSTLVFLNTVDRKLEVFNRRTGEHIRALEYPYLHFADQPRRSHRLIDRIFLDGDRIMLGNRHAVFPVRPALRKAGKAGGATRAPAGRRFVLYGSRREVVRDSQGSLRVENRVCKSLKKRVPFSGKRYFFLKGTLCGLVVDSDGVSVVEVE